MRTALRPLPPLLKMKKACGSLALILLAGTAGAVDNIESLAIDSQGHPRLRWTQPSGTVTYQVARQSDRNAAGETSCAVGETLSGGWCVLGTVSTAPDSSSSGKVIFTDNNVRIDPTDPTEYQYKVVGVSGGSTGDPSYQWASNCEAVPAGDPLADWKTNKMKAHNYADILSDLTATDKAKLLKPADASVTVKKLFWGNFYAIYDNRYIAVLGRNGGLVSLVHRNYGEDLIINYPDASGAERKNPWSDNWKIVLHQLGENPGTDIELNSIGREPTLDPITSMPTVLPNGIEFTWPNVDGRGIDVTVTWTLHQAGSPGLHASIRAVPGSGSAYTGGIQQLEFPNVRGLGFPYADVYWPQGSTGVSYPNFPFRNPANDTLWIPNTRALSGTFLDDLRMQFYGVSRTLGYGARAAMYVAAEDPNQVPKGMTFWPHYVDGVLVPNASSVKHYPLNGTSQPQSSIGNHGDNYDVVMTPMCGGEERIAKRYRRFALQQSWVKAPASTVGGSGSTLVNAPTSARTDLNEKVQHGVWWWLQDNGPGAWATPYAQADYANNTLKGLIGPASTSGGVDVGFHVYHWYAPADDNNMPQYLQREVPPTSSDPVKNMTGYLSAVQQDGSVVMPYINAMLVDITDRCSAEDPYCFASGAQKCDDGFGSITRVCGWFTREFLSGYDTVENLLFDETSSTGLGLQAVRTYRFHSGTGPTDAAADVSSPFWQAVTDLNAGNVFGYGAAGLYLDSFGIGYQPDYAEFWGLTRSRPVGHGTYFRNGSLALAATARAKSQPYTDKKHFTAAEHFNEAYVRAVDLFTIYDDHAMETTPLSQLVYSDYALFAGPRAREADTAQARAMRYGRAFTWGIQLGLTGIGGICDEYNPSYCHDSGQNEALLQYLRTLAKARQQLYGYLSYGEFLGMVDDTSSTLLPGAPAQSSSGWCVDQNCTRVENDAAPAIRAARWISSTQTKAIIMTNTSFTTSTASIPVPTNWRGLPTQCLDENSSGVSCIVSTGANTLQVTMPALSVRYITFN